MVKNTYPKPLRKPGRISLVVEDFDHLIEDQGTRVRITPAILCPNRSGLDIDTSSVNHPLDCATCNGNQTIDLDASAIEEWAFIQSVKLSEELDKTKYDVKDAYMTTKPDFRLAYWYKIEMIDQTSQFNEFIKRTNDNIDYTRYVSSDTSDGGFYSLVDSFGNKYVRDTDYSLTGRTLTWLTSNKPAVGTLYSFLYPTLPTFRVLDLIHENRYYYDSKNKPYKEPVQLPQQAHIRWDYMVYNKGRDID